MVLLAQLDVECCPLDLLPLRGIALLNRDNTQIEHHPLKTLIRIITPQGQDIKIIERVLVICMIHTMIHPNLREDNQTHLKCPISMLLQIMPVVALIGEEHPSTIISCLQSCNLAMVILKQNLFNLSLTSVAEPSLKPRYLKWLAKYLLCRMHIPNKDMSMMDMGMAGTTKVLLNRATVVTKIPDNLDFNHHQEVLQQHLVLAADLEGRAGQVVLAVSQMVVQSKALMGFQWDLEGLIPCPCRGLAQVATLYLLTQLQFVLD